MATVSNELAERIASRLSFLEEVKVPSSIRNCGEEPSSEEKKSYLSALLKRDMPVFLGKSFSKFSISLSVYLFGFVGFNFIVFPPFAERHGRLLLSSEVKAFEPFSENYEVAWHLKRLKSSELQAVESVRKEKSALVKNRRLAYMSRMVQVNLASI